MDKLPSRACKFIALLSVCSAAADSAYATGDGFVSPIENLLQDEALNAPQRAMGALIEDVCPAGIARGVILSQDLADRCTDIVVSAFEGESSNVTGALQDVASEEVNAIGTTEVDASSGQMDAIGARLNNLRAGGARVAIAMPGFDAGQVAAASTKGWLTGGGAGDAAGSARGFFVNGNYAYNDKDATSNEAGFDSDTYGVTTGFDYQISTELLLGAAFSYTTTDADIVANGGTMETDSYGGFGYGTYAFGPNWYVDGMVGYTRNNHEQARNLTYTAAGTTVDQAALSDLDSTEIAGSLKLGFDHVTGNWILGPYARLDIADVDIDGYSERMSRPTAVGSGMALQIDDQSYTSITTAFGATAGYVSAQAWGIWYPQVIAEYVHEFDNDAENITGRFVDAPTFSFSMPIDDPDRDFAHVGVSSSFIVNSGVSTFVSYQALVGYEDLTAHLVEIGLRVPF